jgi:hypothetical protein
LEKLASGRFSDISFVAGHKRRDFCGLPRVALGAMQVRHAAMKPSPDSNSASPPGNGTGARFNTPAYEPPAVPVAFARTSRT